MGYGRVHVSEKGTPLPEAKVTVGGKEAGVTDAKGELVYLYQTQPAKGAEVDVAKTGYSTYRATRQFEPGQVIEVARSEEHTSELQSPDHLVCRLLLEKKKNNKLHPPGISQITRMQVTAKS